MESRRRRIAPLAALAVLSAMAIVLTIAAVSTNSSLFLETPTRTVLFGAADMGEDRELSKIFDLVGAQEEAMRDEVEGAKNADELPVKPEIAQGKSAIATDVKVLQADGKMEKRVEAEQDAISKLLRSARNAMKNLAGDEDETDTEEAAIEKEMQTSQQQAKMATKVVVMSKGKKVALNNRPRKTVHQVMADAPAAAGAASAGSASAAAVASGSASGGEAASAASAASAGSAASEAGEASSTEGGAEGEAEESKNEEGHHKKKQHEPPVLFFHGFWVIVFLVSMLIGALAALKIIHSY